MVQMTKKWSKMAKKFNFKKGLMKRPPTFEIWLCTLLSNSNPKELVVRYFEIFFFCSRQPWNNKVSDGTYIILNSLRNISSCNIVIQYFIQFYLKMAQRKEGPNVWQSLTDNGYTCIEGSAKIKHNVSRAMPGISASVI